MKYLRRLSGMVLALARELSDQTAYERHLRSTGRTHSASEWKRFIDVKNRRKYQNAKCC